MMAQPCRWCGWTHGTLCPSVRAIEFFEDGLTVKRVEFHPPAQAALTIKEQEPPR